MLAEAVARHNLAGNPRSVEGALAAASPFAIVTAPARAEHVALSPANV